MGNYKTFRTRTAIGFLAALASMSGCNSNENSSSNDAGTAKVAGCSLEGTWNYCQVSGSDSALYHIVISNGVWDETLTSYTGSTICSGSGTPAGALDETLAVGTYEGSVRIPGATDITFTPVGNTDDFSCGTPGASAYTSVKFASDCSSFISGNHAPSCTPSGAPTILDSTSVFVRQ